MHRSVVVTLPTLTDVQSTVAEYEPFLPPKSYFAIYPLVDLEADLTFSQIFPYRYAVVALPTQVLVLSTVAKYEVPSRPIFLPLSSLLLGNDIGADLLEVDVSRRYAVVALPIKMPVKSTAAECDPFPASAVLLFIMLVV